MTAPRSLHAYWWRRPEGRGNFGDDLNRSLLASVASVPVELAPIDRARLIAIGSILQQVQPRVGERLHCWGAGVIRPTAPVAWDALHVHAVRGKLTRALAPRGSHSSALGDPALLISRFVPRPPIAKRYRLGIVPHYVDASSAWVAAAAASDEVAVLDVEVKPAVLVEQLSQCEAVVSSSLHGLIAADALAVPNAWIKLSDGVAGGNFKFDDYYSAFDEVRPPWNLKPVSALARDVLRSYRPFEGITRVQERLLDAFPWEAIG